MMQFGSTLLQSGTETQINVKPTVSYATKDAISTFAPEIRDCYVDGEANMTYLQVGYLLLRLEHNIYDFKIII